MRVALVSAVFGGIDRLKSVPPQTVPFDFHLFTETNSEFPFPDLHDRMRAKYFKLQTHHVLPDYDAYIWIDGSVQVIDESFVATMLGYMPLNGVTLNRHPDRSGIKEETAFILNAMDAGEPYFDSRYPAKTIKRETEFILSDGYKDDLGLYECGIFARPNNSIVNAFFDAWWEHCLKWCCFDQNAFPYLAWKHDLTIIPFIGRKHFTLERHAR